MYDASAVVDEQTLDKLPKPTGYKILVVMPAVQETTAGGVYMPEALKAQEEVASIVGQVLALGGEAYKDQSKFPSGPYCEGGDFVIFRSYSGTRFKIDGREFRLINDDTVEAVVGDPRNYTRV